MLQKHLVNILFISTFYLNTETRHKFILSLLYFKYHAPITYTKTFFFKLNFSPGKYKVQNIKVSLKLF